MGYDIETESHTDIEDMTRQWPQTFTAPGESLELAVERTIVEMGGRICPSEETPVDVSVLLGQLDLSFLRPRLMEFYQKTPTYPPEAVFRAVMYARRRGFGPRRLERHLIANPEVARRLGLVDRYGEVRVPSRETFRQFCQVRIDWDKISDALVVENSRRLREHGIELGERASQDTTMLETVENDPHASYNPHSKMEGVKADIVTCGVTGLPLATMVIGSLDFDGECLVPQLDRLRRIGVKVRDMWVDNHYATLFNIAVAKVVYGVELHYQVQDDWVMREDGTEDNIKKMYQELWKEQDFKPGANLDEMMSFLIQKGRELVARGRAVQADALSKGAWGEGKRRKRGRPSMAELAAQEHFCKWKSVVTRGMKLVEAVGAYFRNIKMGEAAADPEGHKKDKGGRQRSESMNDHLKNDLGLQAGLRVKGKEKIHRHVTIGVVFLLSMALFKIQNGVTENLASLVGVE